jgi:hypothetical protein
MSPVRPTTVATGDSVENKDNLPSRRFVQAAKALALSQVIIFVATAIRLLVTANYDPTVAVTIATTGGFVGTILGAFIPLIPTLFPLLTLWLLATRHVKLFVGSLPGLALVVPAYTQPADAFTATCRDLTTLWASLKTRPDLPTHWRR